jgi:regulator of replication initiation timing
MKVFNMEDMVKITQEQYHNMMVENDKLRRENSILKEQLSKKVLLVEDGSVDVDKIEDDLGIYCIAYRQGADRPKWLCKDEELL